MRDPYSVLGVPKSASEKEIKSAFRKLAKQFHPDTNPNDKTAANRFNEANQAYEILGEKEKRAQFDRGEIDGEGKQKFQGFGGGGGFGGGSGPFGSGSRTGAGTGGFDPIHGHFPPIDEKKNKDDERNARSLLRTRCSKIGE